MLTADQQAEFNRSGVLKVDSLLSRAAVNVGRAAVLKRFERIGLSDSKRWLLDGIPRSDWPEKGYRTKDIGNTVQAVEKLLDEPGVRSIADKLLGHAELDCEFFKRPQILVTLPNSGEWFVPYGGWHVDEPRLSNGQCPGVQVFILLREIKPQGGGTLAIAGSHKLLNNGGFVQSRDVTKRLRKEPPLKDFMSHPRSSIDWFETGEVTTQSSGLKVVELTGSPGDAYFIDLRTLHSGAPNMRDEPRVMATHRFLKADAAAEMTAV